MKKWSKNIVMYLIIIGLFLALGSIFLQRYSLGLVRYFDADEFMYVNWAAHIAQGYHPYKDFLMHVGPVYPLLLSLLFWFHSGIDPVIQGRILAWILTILLSISISILFFQVRKSWIGLIAGLTIVALPMPSDKLLEIRPDILAVLLIVLGYTFLFRFFTSLRIRWLFTAVFLLSVGFLTIQKVGPSIVIALSILCAFLWLQRRKGIRWITHVLSVSIIGLFIPFGLLFFWALFHGIAGTVFYSLFILPFEHLKGVMRFNGLPWNFYFLPNSTYYGEWGIQSGLLYNHIVWIGAFILAASRLLSFIFIKKSINTLKEIVIALSLFIYAIFYIWISPLKFPQYLIPVAVFVSWYMADWFYLLWDIARKTFTARSLAMTVTVLFVLVSVFVFQKVSEPKYKWTNAPHLMKMQKIFTTIPFTEYILDLEGRTIYYPYPHPVCCLALGQFEQFLTQSPGSYKDALTKTKTKYIYQAEIDRISALSLEDQEFIHSFYKPQNNGELWIATRW